MTNRELKIAVCSRSFSSNPILRSELLAQFPNAYFNDQGTSFSGESLASFIGESDAAIIALEKLDESILKSTPNLKIIGKYGVGINNIDFHSLQRHEVQFGWTKGVNKRAVAELTIGYAISLLRNLYTHNSNLSQNKWSPVVGRELSEITLGLIGCGHVGKEVVKLLRPFGTKILINDIDASEEQKEFYRSFEVKSVDKEELLKNADIVSLHVPFHEGNRYIIGETELSMMKKTAYLINTARGGLVDESALLNCLTSRGILGAAFDVFEEEPATNNSLLKLENFYSTPHIGGSTETSILAMGRSAIKGLSEYSEAKFFIGVY